MEPISITLICISVFGTIVILAAFIRQMMLSRDKKLNDAAQSKALTQEVNELEKIRVQMQNSKCFASHHQALGANKEEIVELYKKIDEILHKKAELIERYAQVLVKESGCIVNGEVSPERKAVCDQLREEIGLEMASYDRVLKELQDRRSTLWNDHSGLQKDLLEQEKSRNASLDRVYELHSALLEKVYLRHIENTEIIAVKSIEAGTTSFKDVLMAPIQFLTNYFGSASGISLVHTQVEHIARVEVAQMEKNINAPNVSHKETDPHQDTEKEVIQHDEEEVRSHSMAFV